MTTSYLEHANITVQNPDTAAELFCRLFDWKIRWHGDAMDTGRTVHVGNDTSYLALYSQPGAEKDTINTYTKVGIMNHVGLVVDDLEAVEARVTNEGLTITSRADYEPGRRFYFDTPDGIEIEVISYSNA